MWNIRMYTVGPTRPREGRKQAFLSANWKPLGSQACLCLEVALGSRQATGSGFR